MTSGSRGFRAADSSSLRHPLQRVPTVCCSDGKEVSVHHSRQCPSRQQSSNYLVIINKIKIFLRFSTSQWYDENGKVLIRYPTIEEIDKSVLSLFTKVSICIIDCHSHGIKTTVLV